MRSDADKTPQHGPFTGANNSAILAGETIGRGTALNADLRRSVTVQGNAGGFAVGNAWISEMSPASGLVYLMVAVSNSHSEGACFVKAENLSFRDSGDGELAPDGLTYVDGSVGLLGSGVQTSTCLAAGEAGHFLTIADVPFDQVDRIHMDITADLGIASQPDAVELRAELVRSCQQRPVRILESH